MQNTDGLFFWRGLNILLAVAAIAITLWRLYKHWGYLEQGRLTVLALLLFEISSITGSVEGIIQDLPYGFRMPMVTVANLWVIWSMQHGPVGHDAPASLTEDR